MIDFLQASEFLDASDLEDEPNPHVIRVGWSSSKTSLQLGEEPLSFGYGATGKISCNNQFKDYGKPFTKGDIIGCYVVRIITLVLLNSKIQDVLGDDGYS